MPARSEGQRWPPVSYWMKVAAGVLTVLFLARAVVAVGNVLLLLVVALVLAIGFEPAVRWLERRGMKRGWAVALIFLAGLIVVVGFAALVLPIVISEVGDLARRAPDELARAQRENALFQRLDQQFDLQARLSSIAGEVPAHALALIRSFTAFVFNAVTVVILTLYFMSSMPRLRRGTARLLHPDDRDEFERILEGSTQRVGGYVLGNLAVSGIAGVVSFTALSVIGVPYPAALAFWVALTDLVPTIGAIIGAVAASLVAAFAGVPQLVATAAFFLVYQQVENYLIAPRVMRRAIDMSAATVIVAVLVGGTLAGVVGALLAIPVAAIIKVTLKELYLDERAETG